MSFYVFAWIAAVFFLFETIIGKLTSKHALSNQWLFVFLWTLIITILTLIGGITNHVGLPERWDTIIIAGVFLSGAYTFYILALYRLDVSVFSPLFNLRTAFSVLLGVLFLGEFLSADQYILIIIIFLAGIVVTLDEKLKIKSFFNWPIAFALMEMASLALMATFTKKAMAENGYWEVVVWKSVISQTILLLTVPLFINDISKTKKKQFGAITLTALAGVVGDLSANKAYVENVSITSAILSIPLPMIVAMFSSLFAPKLLEKHTLKIYAIRFTAAAVMILAALRLSR